MTKAEREKMDRDQRNEDLRALLSSQGGRRIMWRLLVEHSGLFSPSFSGESHASTAYREGQRSVGIALMQEAQRVAPELYVEMVQDHMRREEKPAPVEEE